MSSPFEADSEASDTELNDTLCQFIDTEAVESDGEGEDVQNDDKHGDDDEDESMDSFVHVEQDLDSDDQDDDVQNINKEESDNEQIDSNTNNKQQLLGELTKPKLKQHKRSRYYDMIQNNRNAINVSVSSESEEHSDYSDESEAQIPKDTLSTLSKLEFEKLVSQTMVNLALKFEENDMEETNPFATMDDKISLDTNTELNMKELLSFIPDDYIEENNNILPEPNTSSSNHSSNISNTFIEEEIRLANNTMKHSITRKMNIERKNYAPPLSSLDSRIKRRKRGDNTGKLWFNMKAGKLTPQNKLHFLMLKHRHILYRKYKPTKVKEDFVPKYFEMGTIIEGPTEFYSSRLTKRQRRSSWANEYLSDPTTKQWLQEKTQRAQNRIRRPGNKFWAPIKKLNVNNRYKLRKKIIKNRKQKGWKRN